MKRFLRKFLITILFFLSLSFLYSSVPWELCLNRKIKTLVINLKKGEIGKADIIKILSTKKGETFSIKKIDRDLKNLLSLGLFSDIKISAIKEGDGCKIQINFKNFKMIDQIHLSFYNFKIDKDLKQSLYKRLREELEEKVFSKRKVEKIIKNTKKIIEENGYLVNKNKLILGRIKGKNVLRIFYKIEGKIITEKIAFKGLTKSDILGISKKIKIKKLKTFRISDLKDSEREISNFLKKRGFFMCSVNSKVKKLSKNRVNITFEVKKGKKIILNVIGIRVKKSIFYPLWENVVFPPWAIEEGKNKILFELRKKGYFFPNVEIKKREKKDYLKISYIVKKGKRFRLGKISFKGNIHFSNKELKRIISKYIKEFFYYGYFDASVLKDIIYELQIFYWNNGFKRTKVFYNASPINSSLNLEITINEGPQTIIKKINFKGIHFFNILYLKEKIGIKETLPFNNSAIQRWKTSLLTEYYKRGFDNIKIDTKIEKEGNSITLTFLVKEGERFTVHDILWIGEKNINSSLFWNSIKMKKGDYLDKKKLRLSLNTLESLGVFKRIEIKILNISKNKKVIIIKTAAEKSDYLSYGLGWGERVGLKLMLEYQKYNLFGKANSYSFVMKYGKNEKRIILSFDTPWKTSFMLKSFFSSWFEEESLRSYSYRRRGLTVNLIKKIETKSFFSMNFSIVNTKLLSLNISPSEVDRENAPFSTTNIAFSYTRDKRDDPFNPTHGNFYYMNLTYAFQFLGTTSRYLKISGKYQKFWLLKNDIVIFDNIRWGVGWGNIPIVERYFAGGSSSFRGNAIDELGPLDPETGAPLGGKAELLNNFEIILPSPLPIENLRVAFFYDKGNIMRETSDIWKKSFDDAVGIGLRYRTPLGPLRIDFGWNLEKKVRRKFHVYFAVGNIF